MIGKCSPRPHLACLASKGASELTLRGQRRVLSGRNRKTQSILAALGQESNSPINPKSQQAQLKTVSPPKETKPKSSLFLSEVERFLEMERSSIVSTSSPAGKFPNQSKKSSEFSTEPSISQKSIFDVFNVPDPAPQRSGNAFDAEAFYAYKTTVNTYFEMLDTQQGTMSNDSSLDKDTIESIKIWLLEEEPRLQERVPSLMLMFKEGSVHLQNKPFLESLNKHVQLDLRNQEIIFRKELQWSDDQYKCATEVLLELATVSHQKHEALPIVIIWEKMLDMGNLNQKTIEVCLQVATSFSGSLLSRNRTLMLRISPSHSLLEVLKSKKDRKWAANVADNQRGFDTLNVPEQLAVANDLLYKPTRQSTFILVRRLINIGDAGNALELIESRMKGEDKLRGYSQVFNLQLELGNIHSALFLMKKMKRGHKKVPLQPEQFVHLIAVTAEKGYFRHRTDPIENLNEVGYEEASGPLLLDQLVSEMSSYVNSISSASAKRLQRAFQRGFSNEGEGGSGIDASALAPLRPLKDAVPQTQLVADRVSIDTSTGYCIASGTSLRHIDLEMRQKLRLQKGLLDLVQGKMRHVRALESFWDWLGHRKGPKFTAIVDGANIAYYMQNFDRGKFNFAQIDFVVTALKENGLNPLVILPHKYSQNSFKVTLGTATRSQHLSSNDLLILERLFKAGRLYTVPSGSLDDYFWISASVADQPSHESDDKTTQTHDRIRLGSGKHPIVITNDQIRDHKEFELLETKVFNRWYSNTIVNYSFTGFVGDECVDSEIAFTPADTFSREIQNNRCDQGGMLAWHFPVSDWESSDWFCIRLPS